MLSGSLAVLLEYEIVDLVLVVHSTPMAILLSIEHWGALSKRLELWDVDWHFPLFHEALESMIAILESCGTRRELFLLLGRSEVVIAVRHHSVVIVSTMRMVVMAHSHAHAVRRHPEHHEWWHVERHEGHPWEWHHAASSS